MEVPTVAAFALGVALYAWLIFRAGAGLEKLQKGDIVSLPGLKFPLPILTFKQKSWIDIVQQKLFIERGSSESIVISLSDITQIEITPARMNIFTEGVFMYTAYDISITCRDSTITLYNFSRRVKDVFLKHLKSNTKIVTNDPIASVTVSLFFKQRVVTQTERDNGQDKKLHLYSDRLLWSVIIFIVLVTIVVLISFFI